MLVFGDHTERADPRERLDAITGIIHSLEGAPGGLERHAILAEVLIEGGRLLQGVADADFHQTMHDRSTPATGALGLWLQEVARSLLGSWDSGFAQSRDVPLPPEVTDLPGSVELRTPEGFAYYALYPEAYFEAARRLKLKAAPRVIGIRSIGTVLGAAVAAALGAEPPVTLRPFGDPFARRIAVDAGLDRRLLAGDAHYIIVDEGPGQSGSSFGAVADWLQERGVPLERIAFLPSHDGRLGSQASSAHRQRWIVAQRQVADFGDQLPRLVSEWASVRVGPIDGPLREISGGKWRPEALGDESEWPPVIQMFERRKFLFGSGPGDFVARFAGLASAGREKLHMARALHAGGFAPEPVALVHGFLVERWCAGAKPLTAEQPPLAEIGRYIGARARLFPAGSEEGASIAELYAMARRNISLGLGDAAANALRSWEPKLQQLESKVRRVRTDNRLDPHEWLRTAEARLLKTDAVDHHQAHDLIGCQDVAWDVAGAITEFNLDDDEAQRLVQSVEAACRDRTHRDLLDFYLLAYAAFRFGMSALGANLADGQAAEQRRLSAAKATYGRRIGHLLERSGQPTRQERLVG